MISTLDVFWHFDATTTPPKPRMVACVCPKNGYYFRVNSKPWPVAVLIALPDHDFLAHDSHLECSGPLELDDYLVEEGIKQRGIIGKISVKLIPAIIDAVSRCGRISDADKTIICDSLASVKTP